MNYLIEQIFEPFDPEHKYSCINIVETFTRAIYAQNLPLGMELPSRDELRTYLVISYSTVSRAYKMLKDMGLIETLVGRGTWITTVLPMSAEIQTFIEPLALVEDRRRPILLNAEHPMLHDVEVLAKELSKYYLAADLHNASLRTAIYTREIIETMCMKINRAIGVNYVQDQLLLGSGYRPVLTNLCYTFLQVRDVIVVTANSPLNAAVIFKFSGREVYEIAEDEEGMVTAELEQLCQNRKIGFVYLNSGSNHVSKGEMSAARISHLVALSATHDFIIIEDDCYKNPDSPADNELVKLAQRAKVRMIYLSRFTFAHPKLSRITVVGGNAADIRKLQERLVAVADHISVQLLFAIRELLVSGKLAQAEKRIRLSLMAVQTEASEFLLQSGLWLNDSLLKPEGFYFRLSPASGQFPPNLFFTLEKNRLYLIDPAKLIRGPIAGDMLILSVAAFLSGQHLEVDLEYFNEKMSGWLIY